MDPAIEDAIRYLVYPKPGTVTWNTWNGISTIVPHGHVVPRGDGLKMRCGGVAACEHCKTEQRLKAAGTWPNETPDGG